MIKFLISPLLHTVMAIGFFFSYVQWGSHWLGSGKSYEILYFGSLFSWVGLLLIMLVQSQKNINRVHQLTIGTSKQVNALFSELKSDVGKNMSQQGDMDQMATTLEELSMTLSSCAKLAENTATLSSGSENSAVQGESAVSDVVDAMGKIVKHQSQITETNDQIDRIAYESRIVSLNSLIEAARAKENGVAFMVVAKHLEKLSKKIISSAEKIDHFVSENQGEVSDGEQKASVAFKGLGEITKSCTEAAKSSNKIAEALKSQSTGVIELSKTLSTLQHETQVTAYKLDVTIGEFSGVIDKFKDVELLMNRWQSSSLQLKFGTTLFNKIKLRLEFFSSLGRVFKRKFKSKDKLKIVNSTDLDLNHNTNENVTPFPKAESQPIEHEIVLAKTGSEDAISTGVTSAATVEVATSAKSDEFDEF